MNTIIDSISVPMVRTYLEKTGWYIDAVWDRPVTIWYLTGNNSAQINLPNNSDVGGYYAAMRNVLDELVYVEKRDIKDIILSIQKKEHINIRVIADDVQFGEIPITDGANLFQGVRNLIKSIVDSSIPSKKGSNKKERVDEYMDMVTFGQTEIGSYSVNVYSPQIIETNSNQTDMAEMPTSTVISDALSRALVSLKTSITEYENSKNVKVFANAKPSGVSSGLCDAIVKMSGDTGKRLVEINIKNNSVVNDKIPMTIVFEKSDYEPIQKAINYLKGIDYMLYKQIVVGQVIGLRRNPDDFTGVVTVQTHIEGKSKNMTISLSGKDYQKAIDLHDKKGFVQCVGDIHVKKKSADMTIVHSFMPIIQDSI